MEKAILLDSDKILAELNLEMNSLFQASVTKNEAETLEALNATISKANEMEKQKDIEEKLLLLLLQEVKL